MSAVRISLRQMERLLRRMKAHGLTAIERPRVTTERPGAAEPRRPAPVLICAKCGRPILRRGSVRNILPGPPEHVVCPEGKGTGEAESDAG